MLLVLDIDGTLANGARRFEKAGPEPSREDRGKYIAWVKRIQNERELIRDPVVAGMAALAYQADNVRYLTSREEQWREVTVKWLEKHNFPGAKSKLTMRPNGCWLDTADYKEVAIATMRLPGEDVILVDDDEHGAIEKMCKRNGFTFLKARSGGQK